MAYNAAQASQRYKEGVSDPKAKKRYEEGVRNVQVNPMEEAAKAEDKYLANVTEASQSGRRKKKLMAVPKEKYIQRAVAKSGRLGEGALAAMAEVSAHHQDFAAAYDEASSAAARETSTSGKVMAAINALRRRAGKPELS